MNPVLNTSGYVLEKGELRILQKEGWVSVRLAEIAEVKKPTFASAIVRLTDGRRKSLDLSHLSTAGFSEVSSALEAAVRSHRTTAAKKDADPATRANAHRPA
jgi:hypothetical protein